MTPGASKNAGWEPDADERDDATLVNAARGGDSRAFETLVKRYQHKVYSMTLHIVRDEQEAWDISQDAFLKAWRALPGFHSKSSFYTWLYRIAANLSLDRLRRQRHAQLLPYDDALEHTEALQSPGAGPAAALQSSEIRERIDQALEKLTPEHRAVIVLKEIQGLQYHEIAEVIGCSIGTVMSRLFYARKRLQTLLRDLYETL